MLLLLGINLYKCFSSCNNQRYSLTVREFLKPMCGRCASIALLSSLFRLLEHISGLWALLGCKHPATPSIPIFGKACAFQCRTTCLWENGRINSILMSSWSLNDIMNFYLILPKKELQAILRWPLPYQPLSDSFITYSFIPQGVQATQRRLSLQS